MTETALLIRESIHQGGAESSLQIQDDAWQRLGAPHPDDRHELRLAVRHGEHAGDIVVRRVVPHVLCVFAIVASIDLPEFTEIQIESALLIDRLTTNQQRTS